MENVHSTSMPAPEGAPAGSVPVRVSDDDSKIAWVSPEVARQVAVGEHAVTVADGEFMVTR